MTGDYLSLLLQIPLVGIFVWFVLRLNEKNQTAQDRRDAEWREFLREERQARTEGLGRLAEEMKEVARIITGTQTLLMQHDQRTSAAVPQIQELLDRLPRK